MSASSVIVSLVLLLSAKSAAEGESSECVREKGREGRGRGERGEGRKKRVRMSERGGREVEREGGRERERE